MSGGEPSLQQSVPDRYFVVTNDEMVRVSHLLIFTQQNKYLMYSLQLTVVFIFVLFFFNFRGSSSNWLRNHWFIVCLVTYGLFLVLLGLWRSRWFKQLWK